MKSPMISLTTITPLLLGDYEILIEGASKRLTALVRGEAEAELESIKSISNSSLYGTERVATNMLNAKRVIRTVDSGKGVINFGPVSITTVSPKKPLVLALSVVLGGMLGVVFILVRSAFRKHKAQMAGGPTL